MNTAKRILLTIGLLVYLTVCGADFWWLFHDGSDDITVRVFGLGIATALALAGKLFVDAFKRIDASVIGN